MSIVITTNETEYWTTEMINKTAAEMKVIFDASGVVKDYTIRFEDGFFMVDKWDMSLHLIAGSWVAEVYEQTYGGYDEPPEIVDRVVGFDPSMFKACMALIVEVVTSRCYTVFESMQLNIEVRSL